MLEGNALVLGAGGVTGVAWETGLLAGLAEHGVNLSSAGAFIGTSAGSVVAAQLACGAALGSLLERQLAPTSSERAASLGPWLLARYGLAMLLERDPRRFGARMGRLALAAKTPDEASRRAVIAARLTSTEWPARPLSITAVNAQTGEFRVFDARSGVSLLDAVGASCAVPGVWPPVTIAGERWIDGGMRSAANADLAAGRALVVVVAPITLGLGAMTPLATQVRALREAGARVVVVSPDEQARRGMGRNTLDPSKRVASAEEGLRQAKDVLAEVGAVWA